MPSLELFLLFLAADLVLKLAPGPDMAAVIARGMTEGARSGVSCALGVGVAGIVQIPAAVLGLGSLFHASPALYEGLKLLGAAYLLWIGLKALQRCWNGTGTLDEVAVKRAAFQQGLVSNLLNPKVYLFLAAFIPQFVSPDGGPVWLQTLVLVTVMKLNVVLFLSVVALAASRVRSWVRTNPWFLRLQDGLFGTVLIGLAGYVAFGPDNRAPA